MSSPKFLMYTLVNSLALAPSSASRSLRDLKRPTNLKRGDAATAILLKKAQTERAKPNKEPSLLTCSFRSKTLLILFPLTEMTEEDLTRHRWWVKRHFLYITKTQETKNTKTATFRSVIHRSKGEQTKKMMLMSSEAGRSFNMLDKTEEPSYVFVQNLMEMWMERGGGTESHSTKESWAWPNDLIYLSVMTFLSFRHPVLHCCIGSITKTHKHGHVHTRAHTQTSAPRWAASEWKNEATEKASGRKDKNGPELLVCYLSE